MRPVVYTVIGLAALTLTPTSASATGRNCRIAARGAAEGTLPRTPWGDPDLHGVWSGADLIGVPRDRDPALGTRSVLTEEEFLAQRARLLKAASPDNIEATNFGAEPEIARAPPSPATREIRADDGKDGRWSSRRRT